MESLIGGILAFFGGANALVLFVVLLAVVLAAFLLRGVYSANPEVTERVLRLAQYAVLAVKQLADNGQYDGLPVAEANAAKKAAALSIIEEGLKAEGIKINPTLMTFAGFAIEAVIKSTKVAEPAPTPPVEQPVPAELEA